MIKVTQNVYHTSAPDRILSAMEINVGHEYWMAWKYPGPSAQLCNSGDIPVQGQLFGPAGNPCPTSTALKSLTFQEVPRSLDP